MTVKKNDINKKEKKELRPVKEEEVKLQEL